MGVYSKNRFGGLGYAEVEPNENYYNVAGALQMMAEGYRNDQAMFEAVLMNDFAQTAAVNEGMEFEVLTEGGISSFFEKIKEFVKKAWAKIVGLFKAFLAKLNSVIMKDNKEFFNKYKKDVFGKDLSKMKFKFSKRTSNTLAFADLSNKATQIVDTIANLDKSGYEKEQDISSSDALDDYISKFILSNSESKSFSKDYHEHVFDDEDTEDGMSSEILSHITNVLSGADLIKETNKAKTQSDKFFNNLLKSIDKSKNTLIKDLPEKKSGSLTIDTTQHGSDTTRKTDMQYSDSEFASKKLNLMYSRISTLQQANNMYCSAVLAAVKFDVAQCRRVYAKAAGFNPKSVKEDALYFEALGEAAEFEVMSSFGDYEF